MESQLLFKKLFTFFIGTIFFIFILAFSGNAYAEYYLVYPEAPCPIVIYDSHHYKSRVHKTYAFKKNIRKVRVHHYKRHSVASCYCHSCLPCARPHSQWVRGHWNCYDEWVPGHWRTVYSQGVFYAQPRIERYDDSYSGYEDRYSADMTTGDDDPSRDPNLQIND